MDENDQEPTLLDVVKVRPTLVITLSVVAADSSDYDDLGQHSSEASGWDYYESTIQLQ